MEPTLHFVVRDHDPHPSTKTSSAITRIAERVMRKGATCLRTSRYFKVCDSGRLVPLIESLKETLSVEINRASAATIRNLFLKRILSDIGAGEHVYAFQAERDHSRDEASIIVYTRACMGVFEGSPGLKECLLRCVASLTIARQCHGAKVRAVGGITIDAFGVERRSDRIVITEPGAFALKRDACDSFDVDETIRLEWDLVFMPFLRLVFADVRSLCDVFGVREVLEIQEAVKGRKVEHETILGRARVKISETTPDSEMTMQFISLMLNGKHADEIVDEIFGDEGTKRVVFLSNAHVGRMKSALSPAADNVAGIDVDIMMDLSDDVQQKHKMMFFNRLVHSMSKLCSERKRNIVEKSIELDRELAHAAGFDDSRSEDFAVQVCRTVLSKKSVDAEDEEEKDEEDAGSDECINRRFCFFLIMKRLFSLLEIEVGSLTEQHQQLFTPAHVKNVVDNIGVFSEVCSKASGM